MVMINFKFVKVNNSDEVAAAVNPTAPAGYLNNGTKLLKELV